MPSLDLTFLHGQYVPRCTHFIDKVFTDYFTLQYMHSGAVDLTMANKRYALQGRWCWSCYPGPCIRFHVAQGHPHWAHRWIAFAGPRVARWSAEGLFPIEPQPVTTSLSLPQRFDQLLKHAHQADRWSTRKAVHKLEGILIDLAQARAIEPHHTDWLQQVLDVLEKYVSQGTPDYPRMAATFDMDASTLRRRFRKAIGSTPHHHLIHLRLTKARELLTQTDLPLKVIAQQCGYRDVFFFSRQFRQTVGLPPARYRAEWQG